MVFFGLSDVEFAIILAAVVGLLVGTFMVWVAMWVPNHAGSFYFCEIYQERDGKFYQVATKREGIATASFTLGKNYQFVIPSPAPVVFYRYGRPVLHYLLSKTRPRTLKLGSRMTIEPEKVALVTPKGVKAAGTRSGALTSDDSTPDTESRSVNLFFRRGAIEQMIKATKGIDLKAAIPFVILAAVAAFMIGYVLFLSLHPGMVQAPPPGYYYRAFPIPTNATTTVTTGLHP